MKGYEHVHFTELANGRPVNPLAPGHMGPYGESSAPELDSVSFRVGESAREALPESVSGRIVPVVRVGVRPRAGPSRACGSLTVAPALIVLEHIERAETLRDRDPAACCAFEHPHLDSREPRLLDLLARGSRQNAATFGIQRAWRTPGTYLYRLTRTPLDTRRLAERRLPARGHRDRHPRQQRLTGAGLHRPERAEHMSARLAVAVIAALAALAAVVSAVQAPEQPAVLHRPPLVARVYPAAEPSRRDGDERRLGVLRADVRPVARRTHYTLLCGRYAKDGYVGLGLRSERHLDWGDRRVSPHASPTRQRRSTARSAASSC